MGKQIPRAFEGEAPADPAVEKGLRGALARAIADAAAGAAADIEEPTWFEVSRIQIKVEPNPGPTSCKVTIMPTEPPEG